MKLLSRQKSNPQTNQPDAQPSTGQQGRKGRGIAWRWLYRIPARGCVALLKIIFWPVWLVAKVVGRVGRALWSGLVQICRAVYKAGVVLFRVLFWVAGLPLKWVRKREQDQTMLTVRIYRRLTKPFSNLGGKWASVSHKLKDSFKEMTSRRIVTVTLDRDAIRAVVFKAGKVRAWQTSSLAEPIAAPHGQVPSREDEKYGAYLHSMVKELGFHRSRVITDLPLSVPLLRLLHLPRLSGKRLTQVMQAEVQETIPFSIQDVDISWQLLRNGSDLTAFAAVTPKMVMDNHVKLLKESGVRRFAVYPKAVAMANIAPSPNCMVVYLGARQVNVVLVHDRVPRVVHQVEWPTADSTNIESSEEVIVRAVEATESYYRTIGASDFPRSFPLVLCGRDDLAATLTPRLEQMLECGVSQPHCPLVYPAEFPIDEYSTNVGLLLADRAKFSQTRFLRPLGIVPPRHLRSRFPLKPVAMMLAIVPLVLLAFQVTDKVNAVEDNTVGLTEQVTELERLDRLEELSLAKALADQKQLEQESLMTGALESRLDGLEEGLSTLQGQLETINGPSDSAGVILGRISQTPDGFDLTGSGPSYASVLQYAQALRSSGTFSEITVLQVESSNLDWSGPDGSEGQEGIVAFSMKALVEAGS